LDNAWEVIIGSTVKLFVSFNFNSDDKTALKFQNYFLIRFHFIFIYSRWSITG